MRPRSTLTGYFCIIVVCCVFLLCACFGSAAQAIPSSGGLRRRESRARTALGRRQEKRAHLQGSEPVLAGAIESRTTAKARSAKDLTARARTAKARSAEAALRFDDVRTALEDIWRSDSLSELETYFYLSSRMSDRIKRISSLERFLCTQPRYTAHVDTYQSARCLALCRKSAAFAQEYASTTCKYFHLQAEWKTKFPGKAYVWTADLHSGPFSCDESLMREAGAETHAEIQYSKCGFSNVCADRLRVFRNDNLTGYSLGDDPEKLRRDFFDAYKHDPEFARVDAFLCTHPTANCELFMPFNKSIVIHAAARIEFGRYDDNIPWRRDRMTDRSYSQWRQWVQNLELIAARPENIIMANNLYDVAYIEHMTGIKAHYMPSWCGSSGVTYAPSREGFLIGPYRLADGMGALGWEHPILRGLSQTNLGLREPFEFHRITDLYPSYSFKDLASHRAIVFLPYQVSIMSFFEYYRMGIPMFVPSKELLLDWDDRYDVVSERIYGHIKHGDDGVLANERDRLPDPNVKANFKHWIHLCDFYVFPHVQYFDSWEDLVDKLQRVDAQGISKAMLEYSNEQRPQLVEKWRKVMQKVVPPGREGARAVPSDFDEAMKELYDLSMLESDFVSRDEKQEVDDFFSTTKGKFMRGT